MIIRQPANAATKGRKREVGCVAAAGWYIRLLRDEVLAEWAVPQGGAPQLHVYCHVSGQERWLAPPQLRNYIFKREMPLVRASPCPHCHMSHMRLRCLSTISVCQLVPHRCTADSRTSRADT